MICGNEYGEERADSELMIRWVQAVSPMPFIQFSIPPWRYGKECVDICLKYMQLHKELAPMHIKQAESGEPLVAPLWWLSPEDEIALECEDQYVICGKILIAPVLAPGTRTRDIYLPKGTWQEYWNKKLFQGETTLNEYEVDLDQLAIFIKHS